MRRILWYLLAAFGLALRSAAPSMALPTAQEVAAKWKQRTSAAQADYLEGVARTDKDPTALAIAAGPRLLANFTAAFNNGSWANGLRRIGKQGWQKAVADKGGQNFSNGVNAAESKVAEAFAPLLAFEQSLQNEVAGMPNVTDNDRDQRMLRWAQRMRTYKKS
jgi:hypothetical protein